MGVFNVPLFLSKHAVRGKAESFPAPHPSAQHIKGLVATIPHMAIVAIWATWQPKGLPSLFPWYGRGFSGCQIVCRIAHKLVM
jgi:hypothetical protein